MSDFDKLLAALMAGGSNVNVTVIQAVHAGGVVNIKNGCVDVEKSGTPTPKKAQGEKKSQAAEVVDDEHTSAADDIPVGGNGEAPIDVTPIERNRGSKNEATNTTPESTLLAEAKTKILGLSDSLINGVVNDIDRLESLTDEQLQSILDCDDTDLDDLDDLDGILNALFPDLA